MQIQQVTGFDITDLFGYFLLFAMFFRNIETYTFFIAFHVTYTVICIRDHTVCHVVPFILFLVTIVCYICNVDIDLIHPFRCCAPPCVFPM